MVQDEQEKWDIVIKPRSGLFRLDLEEVWLYRDLLVMYIRRDIVTFYKQTVLGPLWFVIQPLLTTVMFMFVFGGIAGIPTDGLPQPLFYLLELFLGVFKPLFGYVQRQSECIWKSIFPSSGGTLVHRYILHDKDGHSVRIVRFNLYLLFVQRIFVDGQRICLVGSLAAAHVGRTWFGVRIIDILLDDQIPRLAFLDYFRGAVVDVCHSGYLPFVRDEAES